jgi:3(or 17)beta-hydroxysteroid dehydrogenase
VERLNGKVALVTGGASGLGKAIAMRLAKEGANVVITDLQVSLGEAAAAEFGGKFLAQDVSDEAQWNRIVPEVQKLYGGLHVLVNNAGIVGSMDAVSPEDVRLTDWRKLFAVNVEGVLLGCKAGIPAIHASGGGSIINMSSVAGLFATPFATAYGASKAVVRHLTKTIAQHCAEKGMKVRCNSVHPGNVRTPIWDRQAEENAGKRGISFEAFLKEKQSQVPMGVFAEPRDVAAAVAYLASDDARYVTGTKLIVDSGSVNCDTYRFTQRDGG